MHGIMHIFAQFGNFHSYSAECDVGIGIQLASKLLLQRETITSVTIEDNPSR